MWWFHQRLRRETSPGHLDAATTPRPWVTLGRVEFFYGRVSGNSARSAFGLYEAGARFTPRLLDTRRGENRTADYLAVNPMAKIPALALWLIVEDGFDLGHCPGVGAWLGRLLARPAWRKAADLVFGS